MPKIGTFSKEKEVNPTEIDFDGVIAEWEDENNIGVTILAQKDWAMEEVEYSVTISKDGKGGGGPDAGMIFGTKHRAYSEAYDIMCKLTEEPGRFQEYTV